MMQTKQKTERWQAVASIHRQQTLRILVGKEKQVMDHFLMEDRELKANYADDWLAQNVEEAHIKHQRDEELEKARKSMINAMTACTHSLIYTKDISVCGLLLGGIHCQIVLNRGSIH